MATKQELRNYAKKYNVSLSEARQFFIDLAKSKKANKGELATFYWGYKADQGSQGFEFSSHTCKVIGIKDSAKIGALIKQAVDHQILIVKENRTQSEYGLTKEQFFAEEKQRLLDATENLNKRTSGIWSLQTIMSDLIVWCCAVSTCVQSGFITQDEFNGDKFGYISGPDAIVNKTIQMFETA